MNVNIKKAIIEHLRKRIRFSRGFEFVLQDMWIGVYFKITWRAGDIYICFIPMYPYHISWRLW